MSGLVAPFGGECVKMRLVSRRGLQGCAFDFGKVLPLEPGPDGASNPRPGLKKGPPVSM